MLHTKLENAALYLPNIKWSPLNNEGRPMDEQTLKNIENDYLKAWYVKHIAFNTNLTEGIEDYYTKSARKTMRSFIAQNRAEHITIESTTLEHHPTLNFFSEDGQLVVITDHNVIEYKRTYRNKKVLLEATERSTYQIVMLLEDGFWRIRHMVKTNTENYEPEHPTLTINTLNIKGINYYPKDTPWQMFGATFDMSAIAKDFELLENEGINTIRLFVPYETFGKARIDNDKLDQLVQLMDAADHHKLKVLVTLFDFYGDYSVIDWTLTQRHAETIVTRLKDHPALLGWDVKNEPNLDFESRNKVNVTAWLTAMINHIKSIDNTHLVTIGWSDAESAPILNDKVDVVSFHYYKTIDGLEMTYNDLRTKINNKPIAITEFGMSSYRGLWQPFGNSEEDQADYHNAAQEVFDKNNIPAMSWTLYDFTEIPKEVVGRLPWRRDKQKHFGFIDKDGTKKASFEYLTKK